MNGARGGHAGGVLVYTKYAPDIPRFRRVLDAQLPAVPIAYASTPAEAEPYLADATVLYGWGFSLEMAAAMPKLRWIQKMGAGVEDVVAGWPFGSSVLLTRTDGKLIAPRMVEYVTCAVLWRTLKMDVAAQLRADRRWDYVEMGSVREHTIGIAGLGEIGTEIANALSGLGAKVVGWRRTPAPSEAVSRVYAGPGELHAFLDRCSIIVLVLPLTSETELLFGREAFAALRPGTHLINVGRGGVVDETALLEALDAGDISHATIDVFATEPLPPEHRFWRHPRVTMTPHLSGPLIPEDVVPHFVENYRAYSAGRPVKNAVALERQY
jgi:glyoxylate/hydroxypyruvate reductase A